MRANFAIRLDQACSLIQPSPVSAKSLQVAKDTLLPLVQEAYNTKLRICAYQNGQWEVVAAYPLNDCMLIPQKDGSFQFVHNGSIQTYGPNCRFEVS